MKTREIARRGLYVGIGAGLVLFALAGLLPGSLIGGVIGLKVINTLTGAPLGGEILPRIMLAISMLTGIIVSAVICVLGSGLIGWTIGYLIDSVEIASEKKKETVKAKNE